MKCIEMVALMPYRALDCLEADEKESLERHLEKCERCAEESRKRDGLMATLREPLPGEPALEPLWAKVKAAVALEKPASPEASPAAVPAVEVTIALVCSFVLVVTYVGASIPRPQTSAPIAAPVFETNQAPDKEVTRPTAHESPSRDHEGAEGTIETKDLAITAIDQNPARALAAKEIQENPAEALAVASIGQNPAKTLAVEEIQGNPAEGLAIVAIDQNPAKALAAAAIDQNSAKAQAAAALAARKSS